MRMYRRRACRRMFNRWLDDREKNKQNASPPISTPQNSSSENPAFDKFNTVMSSLITVTIFIGIISIFIYYYITIALFAAVILEFVITFIGAIIYGSKENKQIKLMETADKNNQKETNSISTNADKENPNNNNSNRKGWIALLVILVISIIIGSIIGISSCVSNQVKVEDGTAYKSTFFETVNFSTTVYKKANDKSKSGYITLTVYDKNKNELYKEYQSVYLPKKEKPSDINTYDFISFSVEEYLIPNYSSFKWKLTNNKPTFDKPQDKHSFTVVTSTKPATCLTTGIKYIKCSHCEFVKTETIPTLGHNFVLSSQTKATCTSDGKTTYKCSRCMSIKTETTKAIGHKWGTSSCQNCGMKMQSFRFDFTATHISGWFVGNQWSQQYSYDNKERKSGSVLTLPPSETIKIKALVIEHDDYSDVGVAWFDVKLENGFTETKEVVVTENRGKYTGSKAYWSVTIRVTKVS